MTLKDAEGKPVTGTAVLAIYDKSLEAITGGSNVGPIHENFWKWKNNYYPGWRRRFPAEFAGKSAAPESRSACSRSDDSAMMDVGRRMRGWVGGGVGG